MERVTIEILKRYGVDVDSIPCPDDLCFGGIRCPGAEDVALERFRELWEEADD